MTVSKDFTKDVNAIYLDTGDGWWAWTQVIDVRDVTLGTKDFKPSAKATLQIYKIDDKGNETKIYEKTQTENYPNEVILFIDDPDLDHHYVCGCSFGWGVGTDENLNMDVMKLTSVSLSWEALMKEFGTFKIVVTLEIQNQAGDWNIYTLTSMVEAPHPKKIKPKMTVEGKFTVTPTCVCYLNKDDAKKTVTFNYSIDYFSSDYHLPKLILPNGQEIPLNISSEYPKPTIVLLEKDENGNEKVLQTIDASKTPGQFTYTFELPPDTTKRYTIRFDAVSPKKVWHLDSQEILIIRQKYCHSINIDCKFYNSKGKEVKDGKFPHPSSGDWKDDYSKIDVRFYIKNEQGKALDIPTDKIKVNWQYAVQKDTDKDGNPCYHFTIPNNQTNALGLGDYDICIYIDKNWCDDNGYFNQYNVEGKDILINSDKIEKVMFVGDEVKEYKDGTTYLKQTYDKLSGIFVNAVNELHIVKSLEEGLGHQYSFCYGYYANPEPLHLDLSTYTDEERKQLLKAIMRDLAHIRKREEYQILVHPTEIPKINQTINIQYNNAIYAIPIYGMSVSINNSKLTIKVSNNKSKLIKDYILMLR